jgi:hypothetical protein
MNTGPNLKYAIKVIRESLKNYKKQLRQQDELILSPKVGKRIIYNPHFGRPLTLDYIVTPKIRRNGPKTFIYYNHANKPQKASDELIELAKREWRQAIMTHETQTYRFSDAYNNYELGFDIFHIFNKESNPMATSCYIEDVTLDDVVSPETFDAFKDLYSFAKL